jgi:hypothetical protein
VGQSKICARHGLSVRQCLVNTVVEIVITFDNGCKHPKLARGASAFANEPRLGQAGFTAANIGNLITKQIDFIGNTI